MWYNVDVGEKGDNATLVKHVIFDFDGTLADSADLTIQVINVLAEKYSYRKFTRDEIYGLNNIPIKERLKKVGVPLYRIPQLSIEGLAGYRHLIHSLRAFDGIKDLIVGLKQDGLSLSIISSNSINNINYFLKENGLELFEHVISEKHLFGKHRSIQKYLKQFSLTADEVIYVGDELRDIEASKKASTKIISVAWGFDTLELLRSGNPDYIALKPEEIRKIIHEIKSK